MEFKEDWAAARRRFLALWEGEIIDRCCVAIKAPKDGVSFHDESFAKPKTHEELLEYHRNPEMVLERHMALFESTYYAGEALPIMYPHWGESGYVLHCNCESRFTEDSLWFFPTLPNWDRDRIVFDPASEALRRQKEFLRFLAQQGRDRFFVAAPDYIGNIDALINLRGVENTLLGMLEKPERVDEDLVTLMGIVQTIGNDFFDIIIGNNDGGSCIRWYNTWAPGRHNLVQCDFSAMISPQLFERYALPDLQRICAWLDYPAYHIDGDEQVRHLEMLLGIPRIRMFQWTNVAGQSPVTSFIPVFRKIQGAGKGLLLFCEIDDIELLLSQLSPRGLFLNVSDARDPEQADDVVRSVSRWTACRSAG
jgi:hypothetical protein